MDPIEMLLDENCADNITMYGDDGKAVEFEQIALIPLEDKGVFVILKPVEDAILKEDEALVFQIAQDEDGLYLEVCQEDATIDLVFKEYSDALKEA